MQYLFSYIKINEIKNYQKKKKISLHLNRLQNYNNIVKMMNICEYARNLAKVCNFEKSMIDNKIKLRIIYKMLMTIIVL